MYEDIINYKKRVRFFYQMFGEHIIGTIKTENRSMLSSEKSVRDAVRQFCLACDLNVVGEHFHVFSNPTAITYCFILSQSHLAIHTWPEKSSVTFDLFTCKKIGDKDFVANGLARFFVGKVVSVKVIPV